MANLRTIGQAITMYASEDNGILPFGYVQSNVTIANDLAKANPPTGNTYYDLDKGSGVLVYTDWTMLIAHELSSLSGSNNLTAQASSPTNTGYRGYFICPSAPTNISDNFFTNYACHPRLMPDLEDKDYYYQANPPGGRRSSVQYYVRPYKITAVKHAADIGYIWDQAVTADLGGTNGYAESWQLDAFGTNRGVWEPPYLTDQYSLSTAADPRNSGQPINLLPSLNQLPADINTDHVNNSGNPRFRHAGNTQCNVLMMDGHVQTFNYNPKYQTCDLLRGNIYVPVRQLP